MSNINYGDTIAVWFSCGAASAVAAKKTVEKYKDIATIRILNNPIKEEDEDNRRFLLDIQEWIGLPIESVLSRHYPSQSCVDIWAKRKYMSGPTGAPCTMILKREARQDWESQNAHNHIVMGFTYDEIKRHQRFILTERSNVLPVLIDLKITKDDCYKIIEKSGIKLPRMYYQGYPNANCIGCVKATSATYWNHVRVQHPEVFKERSQQSRELGVKLTYLKGERIFLDDLDPKAKGRSMKSMDIECSIFCEEYQK